jgi:riboflavin kinase/FMN adenylyltransferase
VRRHLDAGEVAAAAAILGRPHKMTGTVVHGAHRGRELGYPTANLADDALGLVPADGVYAGWLTRTARPTGDPERTMPAAISVGSNPTFDGTVRTVEAYVLDRTDLDLYGEEVTLEFVEHIRPTLRFDSIEQLLEAMAGDIEKCRQVLASIVPS